MKLSIIIVNWNVRPLLERCLKSVFKASKEIETEVFVIDNNSSDGSQEMIKELVRIQNNPPSPKATADARFCSFAQSLRSLRFIQNRHNFGFAKANNQAIKKAQGEYILILNPDTEVFSETLLRVIAFIDKNFQVGILGCQQIGIDGKTQLSVRKFPSLFSQILILLKLRHLLGKYFRPLRKYFLFDFDYSKIQEVDQVTGAFFFVRKKVFDQIGLFDERFFIWFEEVDFCYRTKKAGWKIVYFPEAKILHYGAQSFKQVLPFKKQKIFNKSLIYFFKKHRPFREYLLIKFFSKISLFLAAIHQIGLKILGKRL